MPPMKRVRMLSTQDGSPDGVTVNRYKEGQTYDVPVPLAEVMLTERWAEEAAKEPPDDTEAVTGNEEEVEGPVDVEPAEDEPEPLELTHDLTVADARILIAKTEDLFALRRMKVGETLHPKHENGRLGILEAIDNRIADLEKLTASGTEDSEQDATE